jgi:hypothetical protein
MNKTNQKYGGGARNGFSQTLERHPRIEAYDCQGTDESDAGVPRRIVTLVPGFAFDDAARNDGDDPDARIALHSKGFGTVAEAVARVNDAEPCRCGRCLEGLRRLGRVR